MLPSVFCRSTIILFRERPIKSGTVGKTGLKNNLINSEFRFQQ